MCHGGPATAGRTAQAEVLQNAVVFLMRILLTSNPLLGHWLPMLPLARAAQEAGHEVVIAAGPDVVPDIERRGFSAWAIGPHLETIQAGLRDRPRAAVESDADRTVADGMAMFADPAIVRAHDLLDRTADWRPNVVVREIYELGGTYVPADLHVLHGLALTIRTSSLSHSWVWTESGRRWVIRRGGSR